MNRYLTCLFLCCCICQPTALATTADELARGIIKAEAAGAHNVSNDTPEELQRVAAANSRLRLQWIMLNDSSVSEEIRVCYAIRVIDDKLGLHKILRSGVQRTPEEESLLEKRLLLGKRLLEIDKTKAEQGGAGQPATRSESKSEDSNKPQPESEGRSR
jgi:hypothetical protein